jgi:serine/threonine protein kinase
MACNSAKLKIPSYDSFLGAGGNGFVFKTIDSNAQVVAFKISLPENSVNLMAEHSNLLKVISTFSNLPNKDLVPSSCSRGLYTVFCEKSCKTLGSAFYFTPVGFPFKERIDLVMFRNVLTALRELHLAQVIHGDPRLPNLVRISADNNSRLMWIDFQRAIFGSFHPVSDLIICLQSFFPTIDENSNSLKNFKDLYLKFYNDIDKFNELVNSIWVTFSQPLIN